MRSLLVIAIALLGFVSCAVMTSFTYSRMAAKFYDEGDYANAIQYYTKAVANSDQRAETFYWLAMSFYKHGDLEEAMLALERSLERDSTDVVVTERLAAVHLDLGNIQKADFYCKKAIRLDSKYVEAYNTLGHTFYEGGEIDSAEYYFKHAIALSKALRWRSIGDGEFISFDESLAEAYNGLGEISIARGLFHPALDYFGFAISLAQNWDTPWFNKGRTYEALGNMKAAEIAYQRTIDLSPQNSSACKNLARMYQKLGRDSEAISLLRRAMRIDSTDVDCCYSLAELYEAKGDNRNAADMYNKAVDRAPDDPKTYSRAARANVLIGNYDLAIEFLTEAIELEPEKAVSHNALGEVYQAMGDSVRACPEFEKAIALDTLYTLPLLNLGTIQLEQKKESEGVRLFIRAARLGDRNAEEFLRSRGVTWK